MNASAPPSSPGKLNMRERGLLMIAPMVRATIAAMKWQTRRKADLPSDARDVRYWAPPSGRSQPGYADPGVNYWTPDKSEEGLRDGTLSNHLDPCPYGQPGDRLWIKETFYAYGRWVTQFNAKKGRDEWHFIDMTLETDHAYSYVADGAQPALLGARRSVGVTPEWWKRPAIFMPRRASRITLEVTEVRVQRLQDISAPDCIAEGIEREDDGWKAYDGTPGQMYLSERDSYRSLWESINGPGSWDRNDWVWATSFPRMDPCPQCARGGTCSVAECGRKRSSELMRLYGSAGLL